MRRLIRTLVAVATLAGAAGSATAQQSAPTAETITHLYQEAGREAAAGRYDRAEVMLADAVAQAARLYGPGHANVGVLLENLAGVQERAGRPAAAAASLRRSVDVLRQAKGADSIEYFTVGARLGSVLMRIGRMAEAEAPLAAAYDGVRRFSNDTHPGLVRIARDLAWLYRDTAAFDKAAAVQDFLLPLVERLYGRNSADYVRALAEDAEGRVTLGRIAEAEATIRRALQIADAIPSLAADVRTELETAETSVFVAAGELRRAVAQQRAVAARLGDRRDGVALNARYHLGLAEWNAGNHAEAWRQFDMVAAGYARQASAAHPVLARIALARAQIEARLGHGDRALQHGDRALAIAAQSYGEGSARMAMFRIEVAALLADQGHDAAATAAFEAALAVLTRSPAEYGRHIVTGRVLHGKADLRAGRFADAAARFDRALADSQAIPGYPAAGTAEILVRRAQALAGLGRLEEAAAAARESARLRSAMGAAGTSLLGESLHTLAGILRDLGQAAEARATALRALNLFEERRFALLDDPSAAAERDTRQGADIVRRYLAIESAAAGRDAEALFRALQLANDTAVARTVSRVAARLSAGAGAGGLAELLRDLQDDVTQYRAAEELRARQDAAGASTAVLDDRLKRLRTSLEARRGALQQRFPEFIDLLRPLPLPLAGVQALLADDEALFVSVAGEAGTHVALVRRQAVRLWLSPLSPAEVARLVGAIRATLAPENVTSTDQIPPFATAESHALYRGLFDGVADMLAEVRHLVVVADGALQSLPFAVLLRRPAPDPAPVADFADYRRLAWLGSDVAISVLPSVSALKSLRLVARPSRATQPFLGIGDPVLRGGPGGGRGVPTAQRLSAAGGIDLAALRALPPLPETADELRTIARTLGAAPADVLLRGGATVRSVVGRRLNNYRVIAFATHGLVAGEFQGLVEPALVLTPPARATADDDGLLTASRVAALDLDADWVILSACNTAAADGTPGAGGLSGLAQAFFHAGARALLVTHWAVASDVATQVTTGIFEAMAADPTLTRAAALNAAVRAVVDSPDKHHFAHPMFWAPFSLIGDGGAAPAGAAPAR